MHPGGPALLGQPAREPLGGRQAHGRDDLGREPPVGGDAIVPALGLGHEERRACRADQLDDRVEEHFEHAGQVEAGGKGPREFLQDAAERRAIPGLLGASRGCLRRRRDARAQRRELADEPQLLFRVVEHVLEVGRAEARG